MNPRKIVYQILYISLLEIRIEAYKIKNSNIFHIADLIHNIPLQIEKEESSNFESILESIKDKAVELNLDKWLENLLKNNIVNDL